MQTISHFFGFTYLFLLLLLFYIYLGKYINVWYMCVDTCRGKKCVPHIQELELEVVVSYLA